eukprot:1884505-Pyramimonas_sp.AAC.1
MTLTHQPRVPFRPSRPLDLRCQHLQAGAHRSVRRHSRGYVCLALLADVHARSTPSMRRTLKRC